MPFIAEPSGNLDPAAVEDGYVDDIPRGNFQLAVHPRDWQMDARGRLVPVVVPIGKEVGNGSVSRRGDFAMHRLEHEQHGYTFIPHDILGPDQDYVTVYRNRHKRKVHATVFQTPSPGPDGKTVYPVDLESWHKFLDLLRLRGIVRPPSVAVVRGLIAVREALYADKEKRGPRNATTEAQDRYAREMARIRAELATLREELAASIREYGDDRSVVASRLGELLEAATDTAAATADAVAAVRPRAPRRTPKAPVATKPADDVDEGEDE